MLSDHLSNSTLVLDDAGVWINREEYFPYGETSFGSYSRKRYRFSGMERDGETGLTHHGARYYAPHHLYILDLRSGVDWARDLRVIDPCVSRGTC